MVLSFEYQDSSSKSMEATAPFSQLQYKHKPIFLDYMSVAKQVDLMEQAVEGMKDRLGQVGDAC